MQRRAKDFQDGTSSTAQTKIQRSEEANGSVHEKDRSTSGQSSIAPRPQSNLEAIAQSLLPAALSWGLVITLIFGGCCSNVFALEAIIQADPDAGLFLTFAQFLPVVLFELPKHLSSQPPYFKRPKIPLWRWIPSIVMFFAVNVLNNFAFSCRISVPVHIIVRSGGSVLTMIVGYAAGKRFSRTQVVGVALLTVGVVMAAISDAVSKGKIKSATVDITAESRGTSAIGFLYLFVAALLSAFMGLYVQNIYAEYGAHWQENLFYSHFLSLPLFLPFISTLSQQFNIMRSSPPLAVSATNMKFFRQTSSDPFSGSAVQVLLSMPEKLLYLLLNVLTQYACIRGVNLLAARSTALGVTVVLNIRKLVSLLASIWLFGNNLPVGVIVGAAVVFTGAGVYALGGNKPQESKQRDETKKAS